MAVQSKLSFPPLPVATTEEGKKIVAYIATLVDEIRRLEDSVNTLRSQQNA